MTSHSFPITQLAKHINAKIIGDESLIISRLAPIMSAEKGDLTFVTQLYKKYLPETKASAVILSESDAKDCPATALVVFNPELAYARVAQFWNPVVKPKAGIHASAVVAKSATIASTASIGALCVIGENVKIGANTIIFPGTIVHNDATIGNDCWLYSRVTLYHQIEIGNRVTLHSGVVIGADGFGLVQDKGRFEKIPQLGTVIIGDDVEIGANTCVDRGALKNTVIAHDVKIDDLVMIAHNVEIGAYTVIAGATAIAGSTVIGKHCIIGGAVTINGHITICDGAIFSGRAMVTNSIKEPGIYSSGTGLFPNAVWRKVVATLRRSVK